MKQIERPLLAPNDKAFGTHQYRDAVISDKRIDIGAGQVADEFFDTTFENCEIRLQCNGGTTEVVLGSNTFNNCDIRADKAQEIAQSEARFIECGFTGTFDIGFASEARNNDFSHASLLHASFYVPAEHKLDHYPSWPNLLITGLDQYRDRFMDIVPRMTTLWLLAKRKPHTIAINTLEFPKYDASVWEELLNEPYIHATGLDNRH